ncbi:MAG TPA: phenylalanine--tRNA ligase subunit beta [Gemmatimonadota bacterium]|nr:phenylalanine--tRNA ligase subunit beta [Gemmatimonadota bacterium]
MNVSFRWLTTFFPLGALDAIGAEELARRLTLQGFPVDEVRRPFAAFSGVVLGKVLAVRPHPNADRLTLCTVSAGDGERQVVCGAPNVEVGAVYGYAMEGAQLPGERSIRRTKIRGVESQGMLCSAPELGLDALGSAEGIWPLPGAVEGDLGRDLREVLDLDDVVFAIDVTSNRGDALSHWGIAREVQWMTGERCTLPEVGLAETGAPAAARTSVSVEDPDGCPVYLGRLIDGARVARSPAWMQTRLLAVGQRPVNNIVDATNFVMLECGQPLHGFDFDRLLGGRIIVRRGRPEERITTLDGRERRVDPEMTMIADEDEAVAIGGVMGGSDSEVTDATSTVFLESAHFDPGRLGRTARRLGIVTEASVRFARGVDPAITVWGLDRAAALIAEGAGGQVAEGRVGVPPAVETAAAERILLRMARLDAVAGRSIPKGEARGVLEAVGFGVEETGAGLAIRVPGWRFDVAREVDLIEEVARLSGYDRVPLTPLPSPPVASAAGSGERAVRRLSTAARAAGFDEARTPSFVGEGVLGAIFPVDKMVELRNPISRENRFLRPFIFTTLGGAVCYNLKRGAERVKLFEIGHAFAPGPRTDGLPDESRRLALAAAGDRGPLDWSRESSPPYDFFDLKGDLEDVLWHGAALRARLVPSERAFLHSGRRAEILTPDGAPIGFCGELDPRVAWSWGANARLYVAECDLAALSSEPATVLAEEISRAPAVQRDLALVVPEAHAAAEVVSAVQDAAGDRLARIAVFDRYRGPQVSEGAYSLGLRLTFQAERTLTDSEVDASVERIVKHLAEQHGYTLR